MIIYRPCYATREEVRRALDIKHAAYNKEQIDRQIMASSDSVDGLCNRKFFPEDDTRFFDWPSDDSSVPWRLWLRQHEVAVSPLTQLSSGGVAIPSGNYILRPEDSGPPFTRIELRQDKNSTFGGGSTPQQSVSVQGTFGFWNQLLSAGTITANVTTPTVTTITVNNGATPGVGDMIVIGTERMIVQDRAAVDTGVTFAGLSSASAQDNQIAVPDVTVFSIGEVLLADDERVLVLDIIGGTLIVRRAWDGTQLAAHTLGTLFALRKLTVMRGALGTAAATHNSADAVSVLAIPGLVKELAVAYSVVGLIQEPAGYASPGQIRESMSGAGLYKLECNTAEQYGRQSRKFAI